jgi:gentisate 1,2-dioxygenase
MAQSLGRLEDLPADYLASLGEQRLTPLWPAMRDVLPHDTPASLSKPCLWTFSKARPLLIEAGRLTPVEKAERRVLVLQDPGRGQNAMQVTASIYCGLQLLLPGEKAPAHKHTPSAARIIIEGEGAFTIVNGEKCMMEKGDLILTPTGCWHDHGHDGTEPVIWLDMLDLPLYYYLEGSYAVEAELQAPKNRPDSSMVEYAQAGLVPRRGPERARSKYPQMRYPWNRTKDALTSAACYTPQGEATEIDYVNPETGEDLLPTFGYTAMLIRPDSPDRPPLRSCSSIFHVVEGEGESIVAGQVFPWSAGDTFSGPVFAEIEHRARGGHPAFLIRGHDTPLQRKLDYYEERPRHSAR